MESSTVDPEEDARPRMNILRLLISGGLMSPERDHRHRRKQGKVLCSCGEAELDVIHISWHCKNYQHLPVCFRYATIVPVDLDIDQSAIAIIQATLVTMWQRHITSWSEDLEEFQVITSERIPQAIVNGPDSN